MKLAEKTCKPCQGGALALKGDALTTLNKELDRWDIINEHHLEKEFTFDDFKQALDFTNKIGEIAQRQAHHPDIELSWGRVKITIYTHKIDGLTESDFILAAKIDEVK